MATAWPLVSITGAAAEYVQRQRRTSGVGDEIGVICGSLQYAAVEVNGGYR